MNSKRVLVFRFAAIVCASICSAPAWGATSRQSLLDRLLVVESEFRAAGTGPHDSLDLRSELDRAIQHLELHDSIPTGPGTVMALNDLIFSRLEIRPTQDLKDPGNLLSSQVLQRKQGYCVGIAALFLILAERLDLPIFAVATPSHVFLRFDDGTTRINIETLQRGVSIPDEQYIREQKIPEESIRRGVFMRNLTTDEFLAQVHNNLGVIFSERKDFEMAAREYERALDLDSRLPAAHYNYGNDLLRTDEYRRAARLFSKSLRLYPTDVWALNNRGLTYVKMGKPEKGRRDFEAALRLDPTFEPARKNLEHIERGDSQAQTIGEVF